MFLRAKNGCVPIGGTDMDYVTFGKGSRTLIILPGLGDGLTTVKGMAALLAFSYRVYAAEYKVYFFSRKNRLENGCSTRDMAKDQAEAMRLLGISRAAVLGVSQGGMIAQYLAIDYPELVEKLVLAVTLSKQNRNTQAAINHWIRLAQQNDYEELMADTAEKSYSEDYLRKYRLFYPLLGKIGRPKDFSRFLIQAASCMEHNAYPELSNIACPTLIIGGRQDKIVGVDASIEMAGAIKNSELFIYETLGHAAYEEAKDFNSRVQTFLKCR